jgi:hypothetical protein
MQRASLKSYEEEDVSTKFGDEPISENFNYFDMRPISAITTISDIMNIPQNLETDFSMQENSISYCLACDGGEHSEIAFNILTKEYFKEDDKLSLIYVFNSELKDFVNYRNQRDTIVNKYTTLLTTHLNETQFKFIEYDKNVPEEKESHPLDIVNKIAYKLHADFLFCGYNGMKGPRGDNRELSKGIDFILSHGSLPTVVIKEENFRIVKDRSEKGFKWLFVFDRLSSDCYNILQKFKPLLNVELDTLNALTLLPSFINYDDIKKRFITDTEQMGFKPDQLMYEMSTYTKNPAIIINEKINFGEVLYDYVVFYNNPEKYKNDKMYDMANILLKAKCNVCFMNAGQFK